MAVKTMTASPAAGPLTLTWEPDNKLTSMPPKIPAIIPENSGAPEPKAMPRQRGRATKNVTIPAGPSCLRKLPDVASRAPAIGFSMDIANSRGSIACAGVGWRVLVLIHLKMQAQVKRTQSFDRDPVRRARTSMPLPPTDQRELHLGNISG